MSSTAPARPFTPLEQRFWNRVTLEQSGCWEWDGAFRPNGYGCMKQGGGDGTMVSAHRMSWTIHHGVIPAGKCVLHKCDNRACVRPDHLFLGSQADNVRDRIAKGRSAKQDGDNNNGRKLSAAQVMAIRREHADGALQRTLAAKYSVHRSNISEIVTRKIWKHI